MRLYFARHGERESNVKRVHWNKPHGCGLTARCREQAETLSPSPSAHSYSRLCLSPD